MGDFLDSNLGYGPSLVWRSIWSSRDLIKDGTHESFWEHSVESSTWGLEWYMSWKFLIRSRLSYLARMQRMSPYTDSTPNERYSLSSNLPFYSIELENSFHYFITCHNSIVMWEKIGLWSWIEPLLNNVESFSEMVFKCLKSFSAENTRYNCLVPPYWFRLAETTSRQVEMQYWCCIL